jgi:hypothetical protein
MGDVDHDVTEDRAETPASELRGPVLDVIRTLLAENDAKRSSRS